MSQISSLLALAASILAMLSFYLAAPRQQWLARALPAAAGRLAGTALLLLALWLWRQHLHTATALFTLLTLSMLLCIALPYLAALRRLLQGKSA